MKNLFVLFLLILSVPQPVLAWDDPPPFDKAKYPDEPLQDVPIGAQTAKFIVTHRTALSEKSVKIHGIIVGKTDSSCQSEDAPGPCYSATISLADTADEARDKNYDVVVSLPANVIKNEYKIGEELEARGTIHHSENPVTISGEEFAQAEATKPSVESVANRFKKTPGTSTTLGAKFSDSASLSAEVENLLMTSQFDKIEALETEFVQNDERFIGGYPKLASLYGSLSDIKDQSTDYPCQCDLFRGAWTFDQKVKQMNDWIVKKPNSSVAKLALAELWDSYAWVGRTGNWADDVTPAEWILFYNRMGTARGYLKDLDPSANPEVYAELQRLSFAESKGTNDVTYKMATSAYPYYFPFYVSRYISTNPKWFGDSDAQMKFVNYLLASGQGDAGKMAVAYLATVGLHMGTADEDKTLFEITDWHFIKADYNLLELKYGLSSRDRYAMLYYARAGNDSASVAKLVSEIKMAAENGSAVDQFDLGDLYFYGWGVDKDQEKAFEWYKKSLENGDRITKVEAEFVIGNMYQHGWGTKIDYTEALKWYELSEADGNYPTALNNLGYMHEHSQGVAQDYRKAHDLYLAAANQGSPRGAYHLGMLYIQGLGVQKDEASGRKWLERASERHDKEATDWLAKHPM